MRGLNRREIIGLMAGAYFAKGMAAEGDGAPGQDGSLLAYPGAEKDVPRYFDKPARGGGLRIGFMNPSGGNQNLNAVQSGAEIAAAQLGCEIIVKDNQVQIDKQLRDFDQLLVQKVDAVLLYPLDPKALGPTLKKARDAGVVVIGYDVTNAVDESLPEAYAAQVMQGRDWQAWSMARAMADARQDGKVGLIGFSVPVPGIIYLMDRVKFWLGEFGLEVAGQQDNDEDAAAGAQRAANALISGNRDLSGIIAYNDPSAAGAAAAARLNRKELVVIGDNGDDFGLSGVRNGSITATFQNDAVGQGVQGVIGAVNAVRGIAVAKTIVRPPLMRIDKESMGAVTTWDEQLKKIDVFA